MVSLMKIVFVACLSMSCMCTFSQSHFQPITNNYFKNKDWTSAHTEVYEDLSMVCNDIEFFFSLPNHFIEQPNCRGYRHETADFKLYFSERNNFNQFSINYNCNHSEVDSLSKYSSLSDLLDLYYFMYPKTPIGVQFVVERNYINGQPYFIMVDVNFKRGWPTRKDCVFVRDSITSTCFFIIDIDSCRYNFVYEVDESIYDFSINDKMKVMKSISFKRKEEYAEKKED